MISKQAVNVMTPKAGPCTPKNERLHQHGDTGDCRHPGARHWRRVSSSRAWLLHDVIISASSNDERCLDLLDNALHLDSRSPINPSTCLRITIEISTCPTPPAWLHDVTRLFSERRYHTGRLDGDPVIAVEDIAWARLYIKERRMEISGSERLTEDEFLLTQLLFMPLLPPALRNWGLLPLHACAVDWHGKAIVFPAVSGSGKSTLALALLSGGFKLLSDDMPILQRQADGNFRLLPFPERSRVLPGSLDFFPELAGARDWAQPSGPKLLFDPSEVYGDCYAKESMPVVIVLPKIARAPQSMLRPVAPLAALTAIMDGMAFGSTGDSMGSHLPTLVDFVASCRTYALDTGTDFDRLPGLLRQLLETA
jgi:hypothetical protein